MTAFVASAARRHPPNGNVEQRDATPTALPQRGTASPSTALRMRRLSAKPRQLPNRTMNFSNEAQ